MAEPRSIGSRRTRVGIVLTLGAAVGLWAGSSSAEPPDACARLATMVRERGCCVASSKSCANVEAQREKRGCTDDPCLVGCGAALCDARLDEYCCNPSCSLCAPVGAICPDEVCP